MWACIAVGQVPGDVGGAFASLPSLMVYKLKCGSTLLPNLSLYLLWILFVTNSDIGLATDASDFAVVALGSFGDDVLQRQGVAQFKRKKSLVFIKTARKTHPLQRWPPNGGMVRRCSPQG